MRNKPESQKYTLMLGIVVNQELKDRIPRLENGRINQGWLRWAIIRGLEENPHAHLSTPSAPSN